jgi:hypothetical protein
MRIPAEGLVWVFGAGAALGSAVTYYFATRERRAITRVRKEIAFLVGYHTVPKAIENKVRQGIPESTEFLANDKEIMSMYEWAVRLKKDKQIRHHFKKLNTDWIAAEGIISEKLLGVPGYLAAGELAECKTWNDVETKLAEIGSEKWLKERGVNKV